MGSDLIPRRAFLVSLTSKRSAKILLEGLRPYFKTSVCELPEGEKTKSEALGYKDFEIYGPNPMINKCLGIKEGF